MALTFILQFENSCSHVLLSFCKTFKTKTIRVAQKNVKPILMFAARLDIFFYSEVYAKKVEFNHRGATKFPKNGHKRK